MTTLEAKRIQKYVEDREKQNDIEKDLQVNAWRDVFAKVRNNSKPHACLIFICIVLFASSDISRRGGYMSGQTAKYGICMRSRQCGLVRWCRFGLVRCGFGVLWCGPGAESTASCGYGDNTHT